MHIYLCRIFYTSICTYIFSLYFIYIYMYIYIRICLDFVGKRKVHLASFEADWKKNYSSWWGIQLRAPLKSLGTDSDAMPEEFQGEGLLISPP